MWIKLIFIPFILGFFLIMLITLIVNGVRDNKPFVSEIQIDCHLIYYPDTRMFISPCDDPNANVRSE